MVRFIEPALRAKPLEAVKVEEKVPDAKLEDPAMVKVPEPVVEMLPEVVRLSPEVAGERVAVPEFLTQYPREPVLEVIPPAQAKLPVEESKVQPLEDDPPANLTLPLAPGIRLMLVLASDAETVGFA